MERKDVILLGLKQVDLALNQTLSGMEQSEISWRPKNDANSIGIILFHILRIEDAFIKSFLQAKPEIWETEEWYKKFNRGIDDKGNFYTIDDLAAFIVPDIAELLDYGRVIRRETLEYIENVQPDEWNKQVINLPPPPPYMTTSPWGDGTVLYLLTKLVTHSARHAGEISFLRGLKRGMDK